MLKLHQFINSRATLFTAVPLGRSWFSRILQNYCITIQRWALEKTEKDNPSEIEDLQLVRMQRLIRHAYAHVPFWKSYINGAKVHPSDIVTLEDVKKIPPVKKAIFKTIPIKERWAENMSKARFFTILTSGSTGTPTHIILDTWTSERYTAIRDRAVRWILGPHTTRDIFIRMLPRYLPNTDPVVMTVKDFECMPEVMKHLKKLCVEKHCIITTHPSVMLELAALMEKEGEDAISCKGIFLSGEDVSEQARAYLHDMYNCPVTSRYTSSESGSGQLAQKCRSGNYHTNPDQQYLEVLHEDGTAKSIGTGKILITDFNNYAMPLIRYEIGDVGTLSAGDTCTCGSSFPVLTFIGRDTSKITLQNGRSYFVWEIMAPLAQPRIRPWILQFQVIRKTKTDFLILIVSAKKETLDDIEGLRREMIEKLGPEVQVSIRIVPEIPKPKDQKLRSFISLV